MLFYENVETLDPSRHRDVRVRPPQDYLFAGRTNVIPLAAVEYAHAAREYPIALVRDTEGKLGSVAVVGLGDDNLYIDNQGRWQAGYIPAYVRRYPFVPGRLNDRGNPVVCVDTAYDGYDVEDGEPLFDNRGEAGPYLARAIELIRDYQGHMELTARFVRTLDEERLLKPVTVEIGKRDDGLSRHRFQGLEVVDEERLKALDHATVTRLFDQGYLLAIYSQLVSMGNFQALADRMQAEGEPKKGPAEDGAGENTTD